MSATPASKDASSTSILPDDGLAGTLVGRVWVPEAPGTKAGPAVVALRPEGVFDLSSRYPTMSTLLDTEDPAQAVRQTPGKRLCGVDELLSNSLPGARDTQRPWLLAPCDLQAVKASGVTFASSLIERVIEEQARGDASLANDLRRQVVSLIGEDLASIKPGSPQAMELKVLLQQRGLWSQYLEVGIGPDVEVFTKTQAMASVGCGDDIGIRSDSSWNNPEPEVVLAVNSRGEIVGATLGNDVNLRDFEGRSALLLSKAKDNTASCAIGPFIRLFDDGFTIDHVRAANVDLVIEGRDNFRLEGTNVMAEISRDPLDLVRQTLSEHHYPDGFVLFCGTLFAPTQDRDEPGAGFTHKLGDRVTISSRRLGSLTNTVTTSRDAPRWEVGIAGFMRNLASRGLIDRI